MANHFVLIKEENDNIGQYKLKPWLRQNPIQDINPNNQTSHQVRTLLVNNHGWEIIFANNEVYLIKPDPNGSTNFANPYIQEVEDDEDSDNLIIEESSEITFSLERDLQRALRQNINTLENGLVIIDNGRERNTEAGRIDITARDKQNNIVIIELKAVEAKPDVVAQILSYMEAVQNEDNLNVRGIIVACDFHNRVVLASRQIENIKLIKYSFQFNYNVIE